MRAKEKYIYACMVLSFDLCLATPAAALTYDTLLDMEEGRKEERRKPAFKLYTHMQWPRTYIETSKAGAIEQMYFVGISNFSSKSL
jgi:hypothetical protein